MLKSEWFIALPSCNDNDYYVVLHENEILWRDTSSAPVKFWAEDHFTRLVSAF